MVTACMHQNCGNTLHQPLLEEEKIPVSQREFDDLCAHLPFPYSSETLSAEQVLTLFWVSEDQHARDAFALIDS